MTQTQMYFEDQRRDALMQTVDNISYSEPTISSDDPLVFLVPNNDLFIPRISPKHPFYQNQHDSFDLEQFQYPRPPIDLGHSRLTSEYLDMELTNVLRMLIKYPNSEYKIPSAIKPFWDLIQRVAEYESSFNTKHNECIVHITVDKRKISKHTSHRYPGFHGDGIQGSKFSQVAYTPIEHSYVVVSSPPMECCLQPFFFNHLNDSKHNIFHEMEVQAREGNIFKVLPWHGDSKVKRRHCSDPTEICIGFVDGNRDARL